MCEHCGGFHYVQIKKCSEQDQSTCEVWDEYESSVYILRSYD